jgi:hypothetical protein
MWPSRWDRSLETAGERAMATNTGLRQTAPVLSRHNVTGGRRSGSPLADILELAPALPTRSSRGAK